MARILWMDNDRGFLKPHERALESAGHEVVRSYTVSETHRMLTNEGPWDLLVLDVMMNVHADEESDYPADETGAGKDAGIAFYAKHADVLGKKGTPAVVFTVREDKRLFDDLAKLGCAPENVACKADYAVTGEFLDWIHRFVQTPDRGGNE